MEKIHENMCFDVVFLYENIRTCLFTYVFLYFLHLVLTFTPPLHHNGKGSIENHYYNHSYCNNKPQTPKLLLDRSNVCLHLVLSGPRHRHCAEDTVLWEEVPAPHQEGDNCSV